MKPEQEAEENTMKYYRALVDPEQRIECLRHHFGNKIVPKLRVFFISLYLFTERYRSESDKAPTKFRHVPVYRGDRTLPHNGTPEAWHGKEKK